MPNEIPVVLITGASRGIGRAIASQCAAEGWQTVLCARSLDSLTAVVEDIRALDAPEPHLIGLDLERCDGIPPLFQEVFKRFGRLDGLVNNAGVMHEALLGMIRPDDIDRVLSINVKAPLMMIQYATRLMSRRKAGSVVNVASIMGERGAPGLSLYAASKAALVGATLSASKEMASKGIRVNAISPGFIATDMTRTLPEAAYQSRLESIGMGRAGAPKEVAELVCFLLSDKSTYLTGQVIGIDGQMVL
ncbi:SDR family NAD(P)-dependent oxidoreductase [Rhodanobacter sp. UC4437_H4]